MKLLSVQELGTPASSGTNDGLAFNSRENMADAKEAWEDLAAELATREGPVSPAALAEASGSDMLIRNMSLAVNRACIVDEFETTIRRYATMEFPKQHGPLLGSVADGDIHLVQYMYVIVDESTLQYPQSRMYVHVIDGAHVEQCLNGKRELTSFLWLGIIGLSRDVLSPDGDYLIHETCAKHCVWSSPPSSSPHSANVYCKMESTNYTHLHCRTPPCCSAN